MKKSFKFILSLIVCSCIVVASFCFAVSRIQRSYTAADLSLNELVLINDDYRLTEEYEPELVTLANGERVAAKMYPHLQKMFDDMRTGNVYPTVRSGYRSYGEQQELFQNKIKKYIIDGFSPKKAKQAASAWVASPGASEHQSGLAVDINNEKEKSSSDEVYYWLQKNAHKYGFIHRYPQSKTDITGISYEPWHYRYVGKNVATYMYENNLCLEEYIKAQEK